jgi:crotonobetainyl-CoA:carnitine CoA-transferase CaiB-like acyl-CoA transferase
VDAVSADGAVADARGVDFLAGLRVLELGDGVSGAAGTSILAALGADVTAVVDPASTHRHGRPAVADGESFLAISLDRRKRTLRLDELDEVDELLTAESFDLVVIDRVQGMGGPLTGLADLGAYLAFVERHPRRAWVTISAFGLTGPRRADFATELTVAAAGGMLAAVRDEVSGQPLKLGGQQSLLNAGQAAALAACHALDLAERGGSAHLDLSAVETALATGAVLEVGGLLLSTGSPGGAKRYGAPASFYRCSDGLVRISAMEDHQWRGVVVAMGRPAWAERFADVEARIADPDTIDAEVAAWAGRMTKLEAETVLQANGVPATAVYAPEEILESPQLAYREALEPLPLGDGRVAKVVGLPFRLTPPVLTATKKRRSLKGLRMLEASRVLAVPLAGAMLAALGVEVTKLEDLPRLDMYRRRGPYIDGEPGIERSAYFALMNHSKASAAFDVDAHRKRLEALVEPSDVVIENLGPKRANALGLAAAVLPQSHPDTLAITSSGFGTEGPHADYRAYAYNLQASCALGYLTRNHDGDSAEIDIAWADLVAAFALATVVAAWAVGPEGNAGASIDFAMSELVVSHFNEYLAAAAVADDTADRANDLAPFAPHGVYVTADGWIAIAVEHGPQLLALAEVLGDESIVAAAGSDADRFAARRVLDDLVSAATRGRPGGPLASALRAAGIAAEEVADPPGLLASAQLQCRGFFVEVEHPEWGRRRLVGLPWRPFGGAALSLGAPPLLAPMDQED